MVVLIRMAVVRSRWLPTASMTALPIIDYLTSNKESVLLVFVGVFSLLFI
jgi:hypothetical protein